VPGLGLLSEQNPLADRPISFERSPRIFVFYRLAEPKLIERKLVRKPGFAPGPFASRAKMLLLHHNPDGASGRTRTDEYEFTKLAL